MNKAETFVIRRAFVAPLGLLILLTVALLVVCVVQDQPIAKAIILGCLLLPLVVLFVESAYRRIAIDPEGVTAYRLLQQRRINFVDVTELETVQVRSRVFMSLTAGEDDFLIISNSYARFPELVSALVAAVPEGTVTEETARLAENPKTRLADIGAAWFAVAAMVYILAAQFMR